MYNRYAKGGNKAAGYSKVVRVDVQQLLYIVKEYNGC
jgi:hypothetical protein